MPMQWRMTTDADEPQPPGTLWVASRLQADGGSYGAVVTLAGGPEPLVLNPTGALRYARAVTRAAACADHDAAVIRQLQALVLDLDQAAELVAHEVRPDRPAFDDGATRPYRFRPLVGMAGLVALVQLDWPGGEGAQMEAAGAMQHALAVLECIAAAELDAGYLAMLTAKLGMSKLRAQAAVDDLGRFRTIPSERAPDLT
jgi:hypothetical protein